MPSPEVDILQTRRFGDGKYTGEKPEEVHAVLDKDIPWSKKVYWQAKSNGCYQPKHFLKETAAKHPEVTDPEEIARLAAEQYSRQNAIYGLMVSWAGEKTDRSLFIDITETPYPRPAELEFESESVPKSFSEEGMASGMARDEAFLIADRVSGILEKDIPFEEKRTEYLDTLDKLEKQVHTSSTLIELYDRFSSAMNPQGSDKQD